MFAIRSLTKFWSSHPALLYGIASLLGFYASFHPTLLLFLPCLFLWLPLFLSKEHIKSSILSLSLFFAVWSYASMEFKHPPISEKGVMGKAYFSILSITHQTTPFGKRWNYQCYLKAFFPDNHPLESIASKIKCTISFPESDDLMRPSADRDYLVHGKLITTQSNVLTLKISKEEPWEIVEGSSSLAESRFQWKLTVTEWIRRQFDDGMSATFLAGLATGNFDDQWMKHEFARFGLQHIMAISGFHFAIIAGLLGFILRIALTRKKSAIALLLIMAAYCFFLGSNASVLRAWLMCSITLASYLLDKQGTALNSLGVALLGVLFFDPLLSETLAFQLSFSTTAAILLLYSPINQLMGKVFLKRSLSNVIEMNALNQHGYIAIAFFRQALSLTIAVNIFALPLTLYYFQQFPLMGILYNFFFPFLVTGSLCLLIVASLFSFVPFLGSWLHFLNNYYTKTILKFTYQIPAETDHYIMIDSFPTYLLVLWLCLCIVGGILLREYLQEEKVNEFAFI